jgi:hypothetical protein
MSGPQPPPNPSPNILDQESLFNVITLRGVSSPGMVKLSGHDRKIKWDVKEGVAISGGSTSIKGIPPIEFTATFFLLRDVTQGIDDFAAWPAFQMIIDSSTAGATPIALDIYHPDLSRQVPPIASVCKASVGGMVYDGKGGATVVVKFQEYLPPKAKSGTILGAKANTGAVDPNADRKAIVARLANAYQNTPWG